MAAHDDLVRLAFVLTGRGQGRRGRRAGLLRPPLRPLERRPRAARYLRQIVVNGCRSHHRAGRERDKRAMLYVVDSTTDRDAAELADVLAQLPYRQRAAIVLRFYGGLTEEEIAAALRCRPGTVGSLVHRGLRRLREVVER